MDNKAIQELFDAADAGEGTYAAADEAVADRNADVFLAARHMVDTCAEALCEASYTCAEAEAMHTLLVALESGWADDFRAVHVDSDDDPEDAHHNGWEV